MLRPWMQIAHSKPWYVPGPLAHSKRRRRPVERRLRAATYRKIRVAWGPITSTVWAGKGQIEGVAEGVFLRGACACDDGEHCVLSAVASRGWQCISIRISISIFIRIGSLPLALAKRVSKYAQ